MSVKVAVHKPVASVSVVIPCYRCADTIERAVKSVAEQTLKPYEVILVEDCSGDNTLETLYELQSEYGNNWIKIIPLDQNSGPGTARNIGWNASAQDYIAFLDSDDSWHPDKLHAQYNWMEENPRFSLTGHACRIITDNCIEDVFKYSTFYEINSHQLLLRNLFSTPTVMLKRLIPERFSDVQRYSEDYDLWLRIIYSGKFCARSDCELAYLYKAEYGESGLSSNLYRMQIGELKNYSSLYKKSHINLFYYFLLLVYSNAKFMKRMLISIKRQLPWPV
jgi:glycosyltransferase involved in cell wall biosynthesis